MKVTIEVDIPEIKNIDVVKKVAVRDFLNDCIKTASDKPSKKGDGDGIRKG